MLRLSLKMLAAWTPLRLARWPGILPAGPLAPHAARLPMIWGPRVASCCSPKGPTPPRDAAVKHLALYVPGSTAASGSRRASPMAAPELRYLGHEACIWICRKYLMSVRRKGELERESKDTRIRG